MFIKKYYPFDSRMQYVIDFSIQKIRNLQLVLMWTYGMLAIIAGVDKFTNILVQWENYMDTAFFKSLNIDNNYLLYAIGVMEFLAGILIFLRPKIGAYCIMTWLVVIASFLFLQGTFMDVALRCLVMAVGALALGHLSHLFNAIKSNARASTFRPEAKETFYNPDRKENV